jgi:hypothetical protein
MGHRNRIAGYLQPLQVSTHPLSQERMDRIFAMNGASV